MPKLYVKEKKKKKKKGTGEKKERERERIKNTTAFGSICSINHMNEENIENDF
jgi:hypothetical protein